MNILQEACPGDCITKAVVLALGKAILFFGRYSHSEVLLYRNAQDIELSLKGPINWAGRTAQVEVTVNTMQEGCRAMADTVLEKKTKARGSGHPRGQGESPGPQLLPVTLMIGCKVMMRELLMGR